MQISHQASMKHSIPIPPREKRAGKFGLVLVVECHFLNKSCLGKKYIETPSRSLISHTRDMGDVQFNDHSSSSSGQISIIPKPELRGFWGDSLTKPPFRVTSADVVIYLHTSRRYGPDQSHEKLHGFASVETIGE